MWEQISRIINQLPISIRVALKDSTVTEWSNWLTFPTDGYGEIMRYGPFLIRDVLYIEIDSVEVKKLGRLLPEKEIDHSEELKTTLIDAGIQFDRHGKVFRISL